MNTAQLRSLVVGSRWRVLPVGMGVGLVYAAVLLAIGFLNLLPSDEIVIVFLIPTAIVITSVGGGLIASWLGVAPFAWYSQWHGWCGGARSCGPPPGPVEVLSHSMVMAIVAGTFGYGFAKLTAMRHEDVPVWVTLGYYATASFLAFLLMALLDRFGGHWFCVLFSC